MSIKDLNAAQSEANHSGQFLESHLPDDAQDPAAWYKRWPGRRKESITPQPSYLPLVFCLLIALVVRAFIIIHTQGFIDGDEALVGIQAEHILRGDLPIYFYNQPYMGSLEAYIMAGIFAIAGPSVWALRAEPILLSLVVVWLTWKLASVLADTARLPVQAKRWFMTVAALLAAMPPLYDTVLELRTLGGYVEIFIFMLLLMLFAFKLTNRRAAGASRSELTWRWAGIGFIVGLGLWVNPLIIYGILAAALWILWDWAKSIVGAGFIPALSTSLAPALSISSTSTSSTSIPPTSALRTLFRTLLLPALASIPACIVGLVPAIYWGALNHWQNITYVLQLGGNPPLRPEVQAVYHTRLSILFGLTRLYTTCVGPRILSGALPGENPILRPLHTPTLLLSGICVLVTLTFVALSFVRPHPLLLKVRRLTALPIVFASSVSIIFCVTETAASGLGSCQNDFAGRYATPLMLVIPFFVATIFAVAVMLESGISSTDQEQAWDGEQAKVAQSEADAALSNTTPAFSRLSSLLNPGPRSQRAVLGLLVGLLILSVYLQAGLYALSDAGSTFQSTYCNRAPANNDAIIAYMQSEHIQYAWANNWLAYSIVFKTHESIIISDPLPIIRHIPMLDRIPAYTEAVRHADRPSFLILVKHDDPYPAILKLFDAKQVAYDVARFPSQEGRDVLVVTPLNRTVSPFDASSFFDFFFCGIYG
ncbi:MAG TPA: hypothetical protein VF844_22115 [Ktedonobacteraceae bacterium]